MDKEKNNLREYDLPWRSWGSWFSWGSPVGLGIFYALAAISTGIFLYLANLAGIIG